MNRALIQKPEEERAVEIEHDKVLLARVLKAMNEPDHYEPEEPPSRWNPVSIVVLAYAASLCVVVAWLAVGGVL